MGKPPFASLLLHSCLALLLSFPLACQRSGQALPRNLLVLCLDTVRFDHLGQMQGRPSISPRLDHLADAGWRFPDARSTSSWTVPAVASLFTGLDPWRHGAGVEGRLKNLDRAVPSQIAAGVTTLADRLQGSGFDTALFSANPFLYGRFKSGFDLARVERRDATRVVDETLQWIRDRPGGRWFAYLQFMDAHHPNHPPERFVREIGPEIEGHLDEFGQWAFERQQDLADPAFKRFRRLRMAAYDASIRYIDDEVGRLLDELDRSGELTDTLVVVTSDHGEEFWDHAAPDSRSTEDPRGIWGIGHGHTFYDELVRVPLFMSGPGAPAATVFRCPVNLNDVAPTVLAILRVRPLENIDGVDARSQPETCQRRALFASSLAYGGDSAAILLGNWKLVAGSTSPARLFDLATDPSERIDLAVARPDVTVPLRRLLERHRGTSRRGQPGSSYDEETREQLQALGYL